MNIKSIFKNKDVLAFAGFTLGVIILLAAGMLAVIGPNSALSDTSGSASASSPGNSGSDPADSRQSGTIGDSGLDSQTTGSEGASMPASQNTSTSASTGGSSSQNISVVPLPTVSLPAAPKTVKAEVKLLNGIPRLYIDGVMYTGNSFFANTDMNDSYSITTSQAKFAAANGVHVHSIIHNLNFSNLSNMTLKYNDLSMDLRAILKGDPDAKIFIRVNVGDFRGKNASPDEFMVYPSGEKAPLVSLASDRWYADAQQRMDELVRFVRSNPEFADHVFGYHLECGEWFQYGFRESGTDVSPVADAKFREWLTKKYKSDTTLRNAWGGTVTLASAQVPRDLPDNKSGEGYARSLLLNPNEIRFTDYFDYINDLVSDRIAGLAKVVKTSSNRENLALAFYAYYYDIFDAQSGHFALRKLLDSPDMDGFASPVTYGDRNADSIGATSAYMTAANTVIRNGKLWFMESDQRTFINRTSRNNDTFCKPLQSIAEIVEVHKREFGSNMAFGTSMYAMDLMGLGWLDDNKIWQNFRKLDDVNMAYAKAAKKQPEFEVALVIDETAESIVGTPVGLTYWLFQHTRNNLYKAGVSFGLVELQDVLNGDIDFCKTFVFLNPYRMSAATMQKLATRIHKDNKTSVFMYGFGNAAASDIKALTGMDIVRENSKLSINISAKSQTVMPGVGSLPSMDTFHPRTYVSGGQTTILGAYTDGKAGFAMHKASNYTTVFCGSKSLDSANLREIARYSGSDVFMESGDVLTANENFISVHMASAGNKVLKFNKAVDVYDYFTDTWYENTTQVNLGMITRGQTRYIFYGKKADITAMKLPKW